MTHIDPAQGRRRATYAARLWNADYFVVRRLGAFMSGQIGALARPGCRVADIGCGEQPMRAVVEARGGTYLGVDRSRGASGGVAILASAGELPLVSSGFDVVICSEVLEHLPDHAAAFHELARILAPGGHLLVTTPFVYPLHEEPYDFVRLTIHQLRSLASREGLELITAETLGDEVEVLATIWGQWFGRPGRSPVRAALRLAGNAAAALVGAAFGGLLPRRAYLSSVVIARKPG